MAPRKPVLKRIRPAGQILDVLGKLDAAVKEPFSDFKVFSKTGHDILPVMVTPIFVAGKVMVDHFSGLPVDVDLFLLNPSLAEKQDFADVVTELGVL